MKAASDLNGTERHWQPAGFIEPGMWAIGQGETGLVKRSGAEPAMTFQ